MMACGVWRVVGGAAGVVRGARGGGAGGADDRAAGAEARAAAPVGAPSVVGRARRLRRLHALRRALQRVQRARRRAALPAARPAARRRLLTRRYSPHPSRFSGGNAHRQVTSVFK